MYKEVFARKINKPRGFKRSSKKGKTLAVSVHSGYSILRQTSAREGLRYTQRSGTLGSYKCGKRAGSTF